MLAVENVDKVFTNQKQELRVLQKVSFTVDEGEFFCVIGPSGCGKTTLLRSIGGYEKITAGRIQKNGSYLNGPGTDRIMIFQGFDQLFNWKTVRANIEYPLKICGIDKEERVQRVDEYIRMVQLEEFAEYYPHQLSGGMKQRAVLARSLILRPEILLMDEPFASLDAQTRSRLQGELLQAWMKQKSTIIFVTHDIEESIILADRIMVMTGGGEVKAIVFNPLPRPRRPSMAGFSDLWDTLYGLLGRENDV